jgi:mannose-6-phosphate isomerase
LPQHLRKVAELYPNSGGLLVALLMNYVVLKPGDAVYLDPGNVHSYLGGVAVEVMSSSDNVMRAAFTQKHIDLNEFFATASFESRSALMVSPSSPSGDEVNYQIDSAPFTVQRITVNDYTSLTAQSEIELYLCVQGQSGVLRQGQACVLRKHETLKLSGPSVVFRIHEK